MSTSFRTTRIALTHALLVSLHPSLALPHPLPLPTPLPAELHALIREHLRISIAESLLASLHDALTESLSALCDDCRSYNAHVFGPRIIDWPAIRAGGGCSCSEIGLDVAKRSKKLPDESKPTIDPVLGLPSSVTDTEPHAYFVSHVRNTLTAYGSVILRFPVQHAENVRDVDAVLSILLSAFGCTMASVPASKPWSIDDQIIVTPFVHSAEDVPSMDSLTRLKLTAEVALHTDIIAHSPFYPSKLVYNPSTQSNTRTVICSPMGFLFSSLTRTCVTLGFSASIVFALFSVMFRS